MADRAIARILEAGSLRNGRSAGEVSGGSDVFAIDGDAAPDLCQLGGEPGGLTADLTLEDSRRVAVRV
jgi:hypothetical protein